MTKTINAIYEELEIRPTKSKVITKLFSKQKLTSFFHISEHYAFSGGLGGVKIIKKRGKILK